MTSKPTGGGASMLTVRDFFAGQALQSMTARFDPRRERINPSDEKCIAEQAYLYADAMIAEREK